MTRPINFCSGPSQLPLSVVQRMADELMDFRGTGISVMEHSHRDPMIVALFAETAERLKALMGIPSGYHVLFLAGGATLQFAQVPMNLLPRGGRPCYVETGIWSEKAIAECRRYGEPVVIASGRSSNFTDVLPADQWVVPEDAGYVHVTTNETIQGVELFESYAHIQAPVVADMSSHILSRAMSVSEFGLIYAGAQKNLGTAGVTVVIVRDDLIGAALPITPGMLSYQTQAANESMINTPPVGAVYVLSLVLEWLEAQGGVAAIELVNAEKAARLYAAIDGSALYHNPVDPRVRSRMNIPFVLRDASLDTAFLAHCAEARLLNLKGHRSVGGMRASIYNAMSLGEVQTLIDVMADFETRRA